MLEMELNFKVKVTAVFDGDGVDDLGDLADIKMNDVVITFVEDGELTEIDITEELKEFLSTESITKMFKECMMKSDAD